jgi:penicillin G amidase
MGIDRTTMATATSSFSESNRKDRNSVWRLFSRIGLVLILLALMAGVAGYLWFRSAQTAAMPKLDGTIAVEGLSAPVNVIRDKQGVPHITAASMEDLFMAQGYVTAQDRLWQMDITRRYAAGEIAAALGPKLVETDRSQRLLGFRQLAQQASKQLSDRDRKYFEAYSRGVNAYIAEHQHSLPLEFRVLRYFPRAWTPEDSLLIGASLGELLTHSEYIAELKREAVTAKVGPQLAADLYVNSSYRDLPPPLQANPSEIPPPSKEEGAESDETLLLPKVDRDYVAALLDRSQHDSDDTPLAAGSNNWVVSGDHTTTGKPLLSNDMHLPIQAPNTWYEAQLTSSEFDVAGVTLPGMPAVIVGHNRRIAWGFTNIMADVEDVYVETFNAQGQYLTPSGWRQPEVRHERIGVKDGSDVTMDVIVTRHGPIMTDVKNEHRKVAMASTMLRPEAMYFPFFEIDSARDWQTFRTAVVSLEVPENAVYADVDGHIGYQATGLFPKRSGWDGALPVTGSDDQHEWTGTVAREELPSVFDPASGIIATANSRVTVEGYPNVLSNEWVAPLRVERIYRTLRQNKRFTKADMLALQTDVYSQFDHFIGERLVYAIDHSPKASPRAHAAADLLRKWDGRMEKDSAAAAIERVTRIRLRRILLESKLGSDFRLYSWFMDPVWLENVLTTQPQRWLPNGHTNWNEAMTDALEKALDDTKAPKDLATWKYGEVFPVHIQHPVFGQIPGMDAMSGPGLLPQSGDADTVKQVGIAFGPSERFTADLADLDSSTLNIVVGQSGNVGSPHYKDQWDAWYNGTTFQLAFKAETVANAKEHELRLIPR